MWYSNLYRATFERIENLDFHQLALVVVGLVIFGFYCMRGFGSRTKY